MCLLLIIKKAITNATALLESELFIIPLHISFVSVFSLVELVQIYKGVRRKIRYSNIYKTPIASYTISI